MEKLFFPLLRKWLFFFSSSDDNNLQQAYLSSIDGIVNVLHSITWRTIVREREALSATLDDMRRGRAINRPLPRYGAVSQLLIVVKGREETVLDTRL